MEREDDRSRRRKLAPWLAFAGSIALHAALFFAVILPPPRGADTAEAQLAPGQLVDITVPGLGPAGAPAGETPESEATDEDAEALRLPEAPAPRARQRTVDEAAASPEAEAEADPTTDSVDVPAATSGDPDGDAFIDTLIARGSGTGSGAGGHGGAGCNDPIAGTWFVRKYRRDEDWWSSFTLHVERDGETLTGRVVQHAWTGGPDASSPPRCTPGVFEHRVRMDGEGWLRGDQMRFDAVGPPQRNVLCMGADLGYNLDHFTGTVRGNRILAVNNDGGRDVNQPYVFRRTSCE